MTKIQELEKYANEAATLMKALGHKERLMILCTLAEGECSVNNLLTRSTLSQSAFSQQLSVLRKLHLVKTKKVSLQVFYSIANENVKKIMHLLHDIYCKQED